ncbi:MAG: glycosyltransferase family 39 protein, partial [Planctomycetia bacterium]|nr:glycosyltransferase family 39 protein [Planctomycetia bacterium]
MTARPALWLAPLLGVHAALLAYGAWVHSPTMDEGAHLPSGISHWQYGRFELYAVNPPLVRMVAALPVLAAGAKTDWSAVTDAHSHTHADAHTHPHAHSHPHTHTHTPDPIRRREFVTGLLFISANGVRSQWLFALARWGCVPFSLIGAVVCYLWARELYGPRSGLVACALWCFSPNILGHGQLITPDVPAAALGALAAYSFWRWLKEPTWLGALESGLTLGLVLLTKFTWLVALPLWLALWVMWRWRTTPHPDPPPQGGRERTPPPQPSPAK